jgi:hypothetical protein
MTENGGSLAKPAKIARTNVRLAVAKAPAIQQPHSERNKMSVKSGETVKVCINDKWRTAIVTTIELAIANLEEDEQSGTFKSAERIAPGHRLYDVCKAACRPETIGFGVWSCGKPHQSYRLEGK